LLKTENHLRGGKGRVLARTEKRKTFREKKKRKIKKKEKSDRGLTVPRHEKKQFSPWEETRKGTEPLCYERQGEKRGTGPGENST